MAPITQKSSCHPRLGHDGAPFSRPPRGEGHPARRHGPCGATGSCWCGSWCWQRAAPSTSTGLAAGCVPSGFPRALCRSPLCNACISPSSPPATGTESAARTGPSTRLPTAGALGRPPPGLTMPAAPAGRGPVGSPGPVEQRYASHRAKTEGAVSSQDAATALQDGREAAARQTWMSAVPEGAEGAAVPSAVSTLRAVTGASVGRGTARLRTGHSACPGQGPPGWPRTPPEEWTGR